MPASERLDADNFDDDEDDEDDGELAARPLHRGIPSWQETIDVMIANNMEARARNPRGSDGGRRGGGRSGRGGRGGGGRGRSSGG